MPEGRTVANGSLWILIADLNRGSQLGSISQDSGCATKNLRLVSNLMGDQHRGNVCFLVSILYNHAKYNPWLIGTCNR